MKKLETLIEAFLFAFLVVGLIMFSIAAIVSVVQFLR